MARKLSNMISGGMTGTGAGVTAGVALAPFTGGVSLIAAPLIGAGLGVASSYFADDELTPEQKRMQQLNVQNAELDAEQKEMIMNEQRKALATRRRIGNNQAKYFKNFYAGMKSAPMQQPAVSTPTQRLFGA